MVKQKHVLWSIPFVVLFLVSYPVSAELIRTGHTIIPGEDNSDYIEVGGGQDGFMAYDGTLELNASSEGEGVTSLTASYVMVAYGETVSYSLGDGFSYTLYGEGITGALTVKGDGTSGSAKITTTGDNPIFPGMGFYSGIGHGIINICDGGVIEAQGGNILLGGPGLYDDTPGPTVVTIDGEGSIFSTQQAAQDTEGNGGMILIGAPGILGPRNTLIDITNGGLMEALNDDNTVPDSSCSFYGGCIFINGGRIEDSSTIINVSGENSLLRADNYVRVGNIDEGAAQADKNTSVQLNVTNGGAVEVTYGLLDDTSGDIDMRIAVLPVDGTQATVLINGPGSSLSVDQLGIGGLTAVVGYRESGFPVYQVDSDTLQTYTPGEQIGDDEGNLLYDNFGNPVTAVVVGSGDDAYIVASTTLEDYSSAWTKMSGTLRVENGATLNADRIDVSIKDDQAFVYSEQKASLSVQGDSIVSASVNVYPDGLLDGDGTIVGDVLIDGGVVSPGNSPGEMGIDGNMALTSGALELEFEDLLSVFGQITIGPDFIFRLLFDAEKAESLGLMDDEGRYAISIETFFGTIENIILQDGFSIETNVEIVGLCEGQELTVNFLGHQATFTGSSEAVCYGDFNGDQDVDGSDLKTFSDIFSDRDNAIDGVGDLNGDGTVDLTDLSLFAGNFGKCEYDDLTN